MQNNHKTFSRAGYIAGNAAAAGMIFFGGLLLILLMDPRARLAGQFYSGEYTMSILIALALIIGGILIIRRNCRRKKEADFGGSQTARSSRDTGAPGQTIVSCPSCGQKLRVPAGKGQIEITCPRCRKKFRNFT